jgi:hypothetical protein
MEVLVSEIKPYKAKKGIPAIDDSKVYEFELSTRYEASRPVDKETGAPLGMGYPPVSGYPNRGIAYNVNSKKYENWRYIQGQPSIFISEQPELADYEKKDVDAMLSQDDNAIDFRDGKLMVRGDDSGKLLLQALFALDYFEGNDKKRTKRSDSKMFRLNNPDLVIQQLNDFSDKEYEAMKQAREKTDVTGMLAASLLLGINIEDRSLEGLARIKNAFLNKAKYDHNNPKGLETFLDILNSPSTKMKFLFSQALSLGIISNAQQPNKLTWLKLNTVIVDLDGRLPVVDELTARAIDNEIVIVELLAQIEVQLNKK